MKPTANRLNFQQPAAIPLPRIQDEDALIQAALEILHRRLHRSAKPLSSPAIVRNYLTLLLAQEEREQFIVIFLDTQNRVITSETLALGTLSECAVYPREIAKACLRHNCAAIVLSHNHPSAGVAEASHQDQRLTDHLKTTLALLDITVLDHIIVSGTDILSFAERGLHLSRDWGVSFYRSRYRGNRCYYMQHSAIEYIFIRSRT